MQIKRKLQSQINKQSASINKLAGQLGKRNRLRIVLVDPKQSKAVFGLQNRLKGVESYLTQFEQGSSPLLMETEGMAFVGPVQVSKQQKTYLLFVAKPQPGGALRVVRHEYPGVFAFFLITLSGLLCYLLVLSILKPVVQLQKASKRMAAGDLSARVGSASERSDEIGQLGRDFNTMSEKVETLLNGQKRLLADISHELRSPLARLQLSIGIAQQQDPKSQSESSLVALNRIEKEAGQIESMIGQVLTLSRLDNQDTVLNCQQTSLSQILNALIEDAQFEASQKHKQLVFSCPQDVVLNVDPQLIASAIENILRNAIHYSESKIEVAVEAKNDSLVIVIKDDGQGMESDQIQKIFDPFYRSSTARDRNSGGVGLGLAIAYRAIVQHQGYLHAKNADEGGLEVIITLPLEPTMP
jgi:two-component system sensor histidine kinase CpxA